MTTGSGSEIWSVDVSILSNGERSRLFVSRAIKVVNEVLLERQLWPRAVFNGRIRRSYLKERVGCGRSVPTQNDTIRKLLADADRRLFSMLAREDGFQLDVAADVTDKLRPFFADPGTGSTNATENGEPQDRPCGLVVSTAARIPDARPADAAVVDFPFRKPHDVGAIVLTDETCLIAGIARVGIPTVVWDDGIDEDVSDFLRALVVDRNVSLGTAYEYAKMLRIFVRYCRENGRHWKDVDDNFLLAWRDMLKFDEKTGARRINSLLNVVFAFYKWAEETKRLRYRVGIYAAADLPDQFADVEFPISAKRTYRRSSRGRTYGAWITPLTLHVSRSSKGARHTPTEQEIRSLHSHAIEGRQGERNSLIFSWAEETGCRRAEILQVRVSDLPGNDDVCILVEKDLPWTIGIKRKGGAHMEVHVPVDLIIRTKYWIEFERSKIVDKFYPGSLQNAQPAEVFLSSSTGKVLHRDSVTSIGSKAFAAAEIPKASIHRLRARYCVRVIETLLDALSDGRPVLGGETNWTETILIKAAEQMGHSSPESLRPYLTHVFNRRIQISKADDIHTKSIQIRQLEKFRETLSKQVSGRKELTEIARLMDAGMLREAKIKLASMSEELESRLSRSA